MTFIVEDGTGVANANSFITVAFADGHHADLGNDKWTGPNTEKEQACARATQYVDVTWGALFTGQPLLSTQPLSFPREFMVDEELFDEIATAPLPLQLQRATAEIALAVRKGVALYPKEGEARIERLRETSGRIETDTTFAGTQADVPILRLASQLLRPLLVSSAGSSPLGRA